MSDDDIIATIAEAVEDAERSCGPREYRQFATHVLDVLRERYAVVPKRHMELIRELCAGWTVPDDVFLHLDGPNLGYADAAGQILSVLDGYQDRPFPAAAEADQ